MTNRQSNALTYALLAVCAVIASAATDGALSYYLWLWSLVASAACGWTLGGDK